MNKYTSLGVALAAALGTLTPHAVTALEVKNLSGPPEEIILMQKQDAEVDAIVSKSALIPVNLNADRSGQLVWQGEVAIDGENPVVLVFSGESNDWNLDLNLPESGKAVPAQSRASTIADTQMGIAAEQFSAVRYEFNNSKAGRWGLEIHAGNSTQTAGAVLISSDSPYQLKSWKLDSKYNQVVGQPIYFNAEGVDSTTGFRPIVGNPNLIQSAQMKVTMPDESVLIIPMHDDGLALDAQAADGLFNGHFVPQSEGQYHVQVQAEGTTYEGKAFFRTSEHVFSVVETDLQLSSKTISSEILDQHRLGLTIDLKTQQKNATYRVIAEIWGSSAGGKVRYDVPVTWVSKMAEINNGQLTLQLDNRWVALTDAFAPYEIRNLRIQDSNHFIDVLTAEHLPLELPIFSKQMRDGFDGAITADMLYGKKPDLLNNKKLDSDANRAGGAKLMLVHGYCSDDAWGPVESQFANSVKFTDFNKNRSHDQFARLIDSYGDNFDSFGIVAHSQGGAAALHLYTYYWSGLDNAGSGRLIQSVGTPYQGTPLAGFIAALGDIFGAGCGYNENLTTSGASSWLAGIPTAARSKVNYYTTSFTDKWWRPDWCNFASDIILGDPEDGVVERSRGQLSGGNNRGHKTGQCHTTGMRDPGQTRDGSRNASMSNNAAR